MRTPPRRCRRMRMGLRSLLTALVFGSLLLPFALGSLVFSLASSGLDEQPSGRFTAARRELGKAVAPDGSGGLVARPGYRAPEWLILVVTDRRDKIVYSDVDGLSAGDDIDKVLGLLGERRYGPPSSLRADGKKPTCLYVETVELDGAVLGSYYALVRPVDVRAISRSRGPYYFLFGLSCFALVAVLGAAGVSAILARSVMKLEKAALRIASGDLETGVQLGGIREMASLAETMDGMRRTLLEDKDRRARFLAAVSHDLRTPLTSIGGYLEAVEDGLAEDPETLARYVEIMIAKTGLLEDRIQGLIEFERMETGEWRMGFKPLALGPFLGRLSREFAEDAKLRGLDFESDLSGLAASSGASNADGAESKDASGAGDGPVIQADEALLCRAIENIVSNAFKHSPAGGIVRLSATRIGSFLRIDFDDEGPGIPSTERELVFEPFYRGKPSRPLAGDGEDAGSAASSSDQGNGLGLYIARSVIRGHGWDLRVEDSPSGGARLSVVIPWGRHV